MERTGSATHRRLRITDGVTAPLMPILPYDDAGRFAVLLIGNPVLLADAEQAALAAGGRIAGRIAWADVPREIGRAAARTVLCVEARGAEPALLDAALPRIDAVASALDLPIVASLSETQIDIVAASLLGPRVTLLCDPALTDRAGAMIVAGRLADATLSDGVREGEAARLRRLNEEVARIADVLARLTEEPPAERAHGGSAGDVFDRRRDYHGGPASTYDAPIDAQWVRGAIRSRRMRDGFFGANLFEDPAWDMLLDLFAAELERGQVSVSSLCIASAVAPTTALRWIGKMTDAGLFAREPDPYDRRRAYLVLTDTASAGMRGYLSAVRRAGLGIA